MEHVLAVMSLLDSSWLMGSAKSPTALISIEKVALLVLLA